MIRFFAALIFAAVAGLTLMASEPFIGTLRNTKGQPLKGIKVYLNDSREVVKSDKNGEFTLDSVRPNDILHVNYKGKIQDVLVTDKQRMHLIVGEDNRVFEKEAYTGESFHGTLLNHKGKGIRGAMVYASDPFDYVRSDRDGKFVLDNVHPDDTLHIRHDGYLHDIAMDGSKGMYIIIGRNNGRRESDEEVNMGFGTMRMRDYNGPYSMMNAKQLEATGETDLTKALRWIPGITERDGRIRVGNLNTEPMWIIDGFPASPLDVSVIEVKSVVVLKNGMEYGSRGAGGVIIVTTKWSSL
ncbi:MAG: TonB-dependent receptor plug domain-containing protein [Muribaculaceae bacterium]|nr:TonB-dependent receptor plug domain-containing protein [Muribaculaceae bacterium]